MTDQPSTDDDSLALQEQIKKLTDIAARAQADLQNFKARMRKDEREMGKFATAPLLLALLPVLDDLKRAADHLKDTEGLRQVIEKLEKVLADAGLKKIDALGEKADPGKHEVLTTAPGEEDTVVEVHEDGYELHGKIFRPAKVVVGDGT